MTQSEIAAALNAAFSQCESASCPLSDHQKQILFQFVWEAMQPSLEVQNQLSGERALDLAVDAARGDNPLEQLTPDERLAFLEFVKQEEREKRLWKITLLNDWLNGRSSGTVQFIRETYGIQWLEQIAPEHLARYNDLADGEVLQLKIGDRIEVTNGLWEWVQETGPCSREWFPCTVVSVHEVAGDRDTNFAQSDIPSETVPANSTSCTIRFDDGAEYEIQGAYDWNRPNWRWLE